VKRGLDQKCRLIKEFFSFNESKTGPEGPELSVINHPSGKVFYFRLWRLGSWTAKTSSRRFRQTMLSRLAHRELDGPNFSNQQHWLAWSQSG